MARFEVIESKVWRNAETGKQASIYGAAPFWGADPGAWAVVTRGWTIRDKKENTVGMGRAPFATREDAEAFAAKAEATLNPAGMFY